MRNIDIIDESFDINISSSYHISVQMEPEGLSYAIMDTLRKKYISFRTLPFDPGSGLTSTEQLTKFLNRDIYLNREYKSFALIYLTPSATMVPNPLFNPDSLEELFGFSNKLSSENYIELNEINVFDARVLFGVPIGLREALENHSNKIRIFHQSAPVLNNLSSRYGGRNSRDVVVTHVYRDFADVLVFREGKPELINSFPYKSLEDLVFYILYIYEQVGLDARLTPLVLNGNKDKTDGLSDLLAQYIAEIKTGTFNKNFNFSYTFGQIPESEYANLMDLYTCV